MISLASINSWKSVFTMIGMVCGGIVIGFTALEKTNENIVLFGTIALVFLSVDLYIIFRYFTKIEKVLSGNK